MVVLMVAAAASAAGVVVEKETKGKLTPEKEQQQSPLSAHQHEPSHRGVPQGRLHQHCRESCRPVGQSFTRPLQVFCGLSPFKHHEKLSSIPGLRKRDKRPGEEGPKGTNSLMTFFPLCMT